jgi:hypothetical protein
VRDVRTGKAILTKPTTSEDMMSWLDFTPDGQGIVGARYGGTILGWEYESGKEILRMAGHNGTPQYRSFSGDGRALVTATLNNPLEEYSVRVWDWRLGKQLARLNPGVGVVGVAASFNGSRVAALGYTNAGGKPDPRHLTTVWDVTSGKVVASVSQGGEGGAIALSPDGRLVAISSRWKNDVRVYEVASAAERFHFRHEGEITALAFSPDGKILAAASKDAPILLWDIEGRFAASVSWDTDKEDRVWADLADEPRKAWAAIRRLRAHPAKALALLREKTKLPPAPEAKVVQQLLVDLDADARETREKATTTLAGYGESVRAVLEAEAKTPKSVEVRQRLTGLLRRLDGLSPDRLREIRAVEAVEAMPEAIAQLKAWAEGQGGKTLAEEAKAALARLGK